MIKNVKSLVRVKKTVTGITIKNRSGIGPAWEKIKSLVRVKKTITGITIKK